MNKQLQTLVTLATIAICTTSCSVYYTTSQVDNSLKSSINSANNGLNNLEYQMNLLQSKYNDLHCDNKSESMKSSDVMYAELTKEMSEINKLKSELNQEYTNFQQYTQGKDRITSGTPEYQKLKVTRENMKNKINLLQSKGESTVKNAESFSKFVSEKVTPTIQLVNVSDYRKQLNLAVNECQNSQKRFESELQQFETSANQYISQYQTTKAENCTTINSLIQNLHGETNNIQTVKNNLSAIEKEFNTKTMGLTTISSCNNNWTYIQSTEKQINENSKKLQEINNNIQLIGNKISALVK